MKAVGMFAQGISSFEAGKYTRKVMRVNGQNVENAGVSERDRIREAARIQMGRQLVGQANTGFSTGTGTALDALHESAINRELDFAVSRAKAAGARAEFNQKGQLAYNQGKSAMVGGIISGAAEIANEVASAFAGGAGGAPIPSSGGGGGAMMSTASGAPVSSGYMGFDGMGF